MEKLYAGNFVYKGGLGSLKKLLSENGIKGSLVKILIRNGVNKKEAEKMVQSQNLIL